MNNKRLGLIILSISIVLAFIIINIIGKYNQAVIQEDCYPTNNCKQIESSLTITHFAFGAIGFIMALGFYLVFFSKGEELLLNKLEEDKKLMFKENKFNILLKALDLYEQTVLKAVKEQEGITQNTLRLKTDLSKAKVSYVLQDLEKKGLVKRVEKGKTYAVYLKV